MTLESTIAMALALVVLAASPGPGALATVGTALSSGFRQALFLIVGIVLGDIFFLCLAVFGLSMLANSLGEFFMVVKIAGGAYLIWLGLSRIIAKEEGFAVGAEVSAQRGASAVLSGLGVTLANPKVILFYVGFLPTFVDVSVFTRFDLVVASLVIVCVIGGMLAGYAYAASVARCLFTSKHAVRVLNRVSGAVLVGAGIAVATRS